MKRSGIKPVLTERIEIVLKETDGFSGRIYAHPQQAIKGLQASLQPSSFFSSSFWQLFFFEQHVSFAIGFP